MANKRDLPEGIYRRGRILWTKVYEKGKPVPESTGTSDVAEAVRIRNARRAKADSGKLVATVRMTKIKIDELVADDLQRMELECKPGTVRWAQRGFDLHILPVFGELGVSELTTDLLQGYIRDRMHEGAAKSSINNELSLLRSALYTGYRRTPPKVDRVMSFPLFPKSQLTVRTGFLEWEAYLRMRDVIEASLKPLLVVLYHMGLRKGEAIGLLWQQVEFPVGRQHGAIRLHPLETKNGEARTFPMYGDVEPALRAQKELRDRLFPGQDHVFFWHPESVSTSGNEGGLRVQPGSRLGGAGGNFRATKGWESAAAAIGYPDLLMHDMRRSAVHNMIEKAGMSVKQAMLYSGHLTMSMAERYHMLGLGELKSAHSKLETMYREHTQPSEPEPEDAPELEPPPPTNVISFSSLRRRA